ncbi:MAG: acyltransferase [Flavobacteriaceae bacterium CG2_30_34_30]|nr:MAG: acyltransferase [Flavobacteriaceae bacterium CG2_30_34_30]PIV49783.1 MAG: acyltransferase [Flavobacteriaceae bacterium CG02_land_8_20_14_3_00_34_13]PIZ07309.1 MAG: acyltransferase [Flavobacteriaceae bacterium CG_4_10_14_0_8_um_filter_34_31]PJC08078.1 MAG: acyltransferase [Flavobacteriaceae bacterium CG_4_9_14_0_8_um_filter_34_30]
MRWLASLFYFKILGWKVAGNLSLEIKKCVIIVVPHTSWHDFYIGAIIRKIIGLEINFIAKKELFDSPFGWYFQWMGGSPINRTSKQNKVDEVVKIFNSKETFRLALAPEGTRKKVNSWKTGFYYIALAAQVPIICIAFDYGTKTVKIAPPFYPSGNINFDLPKLKEFYKGVVGKIPENT